MQGISQMHLATKAWNNKKLEEYLDEIVDIKETFDDCSALDISNWELIVQWI